MPIFPGDKPRKPLLTEASDLTLLAAKTKEIVIAQEGMPDDLKELLTRAIECIPQVNLDDDEGFAGQALRLAGITKEELGEECYVYMLGYLAGCMMLVWQKLWHIPTYVDRFSPNDGSAIAV